LIYNNYLIFLVIGLQDLGTSDPSLFAHRFFKSRWAS